MKIKFPVVVLILALTICTWAQSGGTFVIEKSVIAGGGGSAAGGTFALDGTIGQSLAGTTSSGGVYSIDSGFWAAASAPGTLSGTITYLNAIGNPPAPRFVSNVTITGSGSPGVATTTGPPGATAGQYTLTGFGAGAYTVTPTKTGGVNAAISSFDAGRIALHVAGPPNPQLNPTQLLVADVSGNSQVTSFDAGMIAKYAAGPPYEAPGIGATGTWKFTPVNRVYGSITSNITGEDYTAILMGDVSGNWANTGARPDLGGVTQVQLASSLSRTSPQTAAPADEKQATANTRSGVIVAMPRMTSDKKEIVVPVSVEGVANKGVIAYEFDLRYDASVMLPTLSPADVAGTVSDGLIAVMNAAEPGLLRIVVYGPKAIVADGVLINLHFNRIGAKGSASPLALERVMFNEGEPRVDVIDGKVDLF